MIRNVTKISAIAFLGTIAPLLANADPLPSGSAQPSGISSSSQLKSAPVTVAQNSESPYQLKLQYTGEEWDNAQGGQRTGTVYMQNVDAQMRINTDQAFGWTGGRALIEAFYNNSRSLDTQFNNTLQDASVIDTAGQTMFRLYQAYYDQALGNTDLLFGIYDLQTEFDHEKSAEVFFNGAYNWNQALDQSGGGGLNGPSTYPTTAPAFRVHEKINNEWSVAGALADGMADSAKYPGTNAVVLNKQAGLFGIGEIDYVPVPRTKIMAGYWGYTSKFDTLNQTNPDGSTHQVYGSNGGYIGGETRLYTQEGRRGLDGFVNLGLADPTVNIIDRSLNAGLTYTGLLDARPGDRLGFAVGIAGVSDPYRKAQIAAGNAVEHDETNFEVTYRAPINSWLVVQPDIQYWIHPDVNPAYRDDLLIGVHFEIGHLFNM